MTCEIVSREDRSQSEYSTSLTGGMKHFLKSGKDCEPIMFFQTCNQVIDDKEEFHPHEKNPKWYPTAEINSVGLLEMICLSEASVVEEQLVWEKEASSFGCQNTRLGLGSIHLSTERWYCFGLS